MSPRQQVDLFGILNLAPNSFQGVGRQVEPEKALAHVDQLFAEGAAYVDVGAEATNPSAEPIGHKLEWERLMPVLPTLLERYPGRISVDSRYPETTQRASELGEIIVNDVTTFRDPKMIELAVRTGSICIASHLPDWVKGDIGLAHRATGKLLNDEQVVKDELLAHRQQMIEAGIAPGKIILDPGIGFGKTPALNRKLLRFAEQVPDIPVMIGFSHKRFLGEHHRHLPRYNQEAAYIAAQSGTRYLRVHEIGIYKSLI